MPTLRIAPRYHRKAAVLDAAATLLTLMLASTLAFIAVTLASPARADATSDAWADRYGVAVCLTLADYPSLGGLSGILLSATEDGLSDRQAGEAVASSVIANCPEYVYLLKAFVRRYGQAASKQVA